MKGTQWYAEATEELMAPTLLPELHLLKQVKEVSILMRNLIAQFVSQTVQEQRLSDFSFVACPTLARLWTTLSRSNGSKDNSVTMEHVLNYATCFSSVLIITLSRSDVAGSSLCQKASL